MKKFVVSVFCFSLIFISCSKKTEMKAANNPVLAESTADLATLPVSQPAVSTPTPTSSSDSPTASSNSNTSKSGKIDLDLTKMSATMIYSTIFDMLIMPEDYIEKNIKLTGWFETYTDPNTAELYYAVIVPDATACCQQGLEFIWPGDHHSPADFPDPGSDITVTGRYKLTETDGVSYVYLEASSVEF